AALRDFVATGQNLLQSYLSSRAKAGELRPELVRAAASTLFAAVAIGHKTARRVNTDELVELVLNGSATEISLGGCHVVSFQRSPARPGAVAVPGPGRWIWNVG